MDSRVRMVTFHLNISRWYSTPSFWWHCSTRSIVDAFTAKSMYSVVSSPISCFVGSGSVHWSFKSSSSSVVHWFSPVFHCRSTYGCGPFSSGLVRYSGIKYTLSIDRHTPCCLSSLLLQFVNLIPTPSCYCIQRWNGETEESANGIENDGYDKLNDAHPARASTVSDFQPRISDSDLRFIRILWLRNIKRIQVQVKRERVFHLPLRKEMVNGDD